MKIKKILIKRLFKCFNYEIPFKDGINILHGINGKGKTTILNIIANIFKGEFKQFYQLSFQEIFVEFDSGQYLKIYRQTIKKTSKILLDYYLAGDKFENREITNTNSIKAFLKRVDISPLFLPTHRLFFSESRYSERYYSRYRYSIAQNNGPFGVRNTNVTNNKYITINELKRHLTEKARKISWMARNIFTELDNELFEKFFHAIFFANNPPSLDFIFENKTTSFNKIKEIKKIRDNFFENNCIKLNEQNKLLDQVETYISNITGINNEINVFLDLYLKNMEEKKSRISELTIPFSNFETIINSLFEQKKIKISLESNIDDIFSIENEAKDKLDIEQLSSGEQNLLIIFYNFLFQIKRNVIFMIDEPELSLHIDWQSNIISFFKKYSQDNQILIVTHSPDILQNHRDCEINLSNCSLEE